MAVWNDRDILASVQSGRFASTPWHEADLTPNGLDLRIGHALVPAVMTAAVSEGTVQVPPMTRFVVGTESVVRMPDDVAGSLWLRSTYSRKGVIAAFGKVDAGFEGNLTIGALHTGHEPLELKIGDRFCQIVLEDLTGPSEKAYAKRSGNYQHQRGVTLSPQ